MKKLINFTHWFCWVIFIVVTFIYTVYLWASQTWLIRDLSEARFTLAAGLFHAPLKTFAHNALPAILTYFGIIVISVIIMSVFIFYITRKTTDSVKHVVNPGSIIFAKLHTLLLLIIIISAMFYQCASFYWNIFNWADYESTHLTDIYEKEHAFPSSDNVIAPYANGQKPRSIVMLTLESITHSSLSYMPELTKLINTSYDILMNGPGSVGAVYSTIGTNWTSAFTWAMATGVPWNLEFRKSGKSLTTYYPGLMNYKLTTIFEILHKGGFNIEYICGSPGSFGGRSEFMQPRGVNIFDYEQMKLHKFIPADYDIWWGAEDQKLYSVAQNRISRLAAQEKPFFAMVLTTDTHAPGGYLCERCPEIYQYQYLNILACASKQAAQFIHWLRSQSFADEISIIIVGDHPYPLLNESGYISSETDNIFMAILNVPKPLAQKISSRYREGTTMDLFPTLLDLAGYTVKNGRLGLGTSLFNLRLTLAESIGLDVLNKELMGRSDFYQAAYY